MTVDLVELFGVELTQDSHRHVVLVNATNTRRELIVMPKRQLQEIAAGLELRGRSQWRKRTLVRQIEIAKAARCQAI